MTNYESNAEFMAWIAELDAAATARGVEGEPYSKQTGLDCWYDYFDDGYSPVEALLEDWSYAAADME